MGSGARGRQKEASVNGYVYYTFINKSNLYQ